MFWLQFLLMFPQTTTCGRVDLNHTFFYKYYINSNIAMLWYLCHYLLDDADIFQYFIKAINNFSKRNQNVHIYESPIIVISFYLLNLKKKCLLYNFVLQFILIYPQTTICWRVDLNHTLYKDYTNSNIAVLWYLCHHFRDDAEIFDSFTEAINCFSKRNLTKTFSFINPQDIFISQICFQCMQSLTAPVIKQTDILYIPETRIGLLISFHSMVSGPYWFFYFFLLEIRPSQLR